jgi:hypothetical protein
VIDTIKFPLVASEIGTTGKSSVRDKSGRWIAFNLDADVAEWMTSIPARVAELEQVTQERDTARDACACALGNLDHLVETWGAEGITRTVQDKLRKALTTEDTPQS